MRVRHTVLLQLVIWQQEHLVAFPKSCRHPPRNDRDPRAWRSWRGRDEIQKIGQTSSITYRFFNYRAIEYDISLEVLQGKAIIFFSPMICGRGSSPWTRSIRHTEGALSSRTQTNPHGCGSWGFRLLENVSNSDTCFSSPWWDRVVVPTPTPRMRLLGYEQNT